MVQKSYSGRPRPQQAPQETRLARAIPRKKRGPKTFTIPVLGIRLRNEPLTWIILGGIGVVTAIVGVLAMVGMMFVLTLSSGRVLPGVQVAGIPVGNLSVEDATAQLAAQFGAITVRDGERNWRIAAADLGIIVDSAATAANAARYGRGEGSVMLGFFGGASVAPVFRLDSARATTGLQALAKMVELPARNASVRMENSQPVAVPSSVGRQLNIADTLARLSQGGAAFNANGLELSMTTTYPSVTDASGLVEKARALLSSPLTINAFNAVTNKSRVWAIPPETWTNWLTTENTAAGLNFSVDVNGLTSYLNGKAPELGASETLKIPESVAAVQKAIAAQNPTVNVRVYNQPVRYTIVPGDTLGGLSWKFGIQMFRIQKANPGVNIDALSPGQVITLPSKDDLLPLPVVFNKRIVVSITRQRMWVYENGTVKWEWSASTGIPSSPTLPGIYQVQSHDGTAYAGNWNLYMPYFMSIYEAVPGFYNGIHGFPSRGGSQILWEGSLGREVTYGCILLSTTNARQLYEWAQDGVVTEIQP